MDVIRFSEQRDIAWKGDHRVIIDPNGPLCYYTDLKFYRGGYHFVLGINILLVFVTIVALLYAFNHSHETAVPLSGQERTEEQTEKDETALTQKSMMHEWHKEHAPKVETRLSVSRVRVNAAEATRVTESADAVRAVVPVSVGDQQLIALAIEAGFTAGKIRVKP